MWFGTDNGLARFDGRRVQNFSLGNPNANRVLALETAPTGELWIGTRAGAFLYSDNRLHLISNTEEFGITTILFGNVSYIGTDNGYVLRVVSRGDGTFTAEKGFSEPLPGLDNLPIAVTGLVETNGTLLVATSGRGVFSVKDGNLNVVHTPPSPGMINSLKIGDGFILLGTDAPKGSSGIYRSTGGPRFERIAAPTSKTLTLESNNSGVWAGTERYGLFHFEASKLKTNYTFENTSGGLRSDTIFELFTDREGVVWIGTNRGVSRFDRLGPFQQNVSDIANSNFIRTLFRTRDGRIYAGSNRGLFVKSEEKWTTVASYANKPIYAVSEDLVGNLLVGSTEKIGNDTRSFADFKSGKYAAVSGQGLVEIGSGGYTLRHSDGSVNTLFSASDKLWIGTTAKGLFSFDGRSVKLEFSPESLKSGAIWRILEDTSRTIWIAGQHGVFRVRDGQPEKIIDAEDVRDVFVDSKDVWAATTTRGLLHARHDEQFGWLVSSVGFEQGLPSEKAFSILPVSDGLLIATNRGVVTYRPGTVAPKLIPTRILSQRMHDLGELRSTIELEYPQSSLLIEVAGQSSRTFPEEFQYAFLLKNAGGDILDSRLSNEPQYAPADLKPGSYSIETRAFDRDLLSSEPLTITFSVARAPFPLTATALGVLLAIAVVALIWAIIERRRIALSNRELAAARLDLANEAERERRRIARDLHDQTLADLRNLMMATDKLTPPNPEFRDEIEAVSTEIRRICEDLSPSVLENVGLVAALEFLLSHTIENHKFTAAENAEDMIRFPVNAQLQIYRIAQEVLANIKRHSNAGLVEMEVSVAGGESFQMTILDDGDPFEPSAGSKKGRGIPNIRSRASLIRSEIEWEKLEAGNRFSLTKNIDAAT